MLDYRSWLGLGDEGDEDDPVKKALGVLGQGASTVGQAAQDVGAGIGQAVSDAGAAVSSYLPQPSVSPAPEDYSFAPPDNPLATGLAAAGKAGVEAYEETGGPLSPWSAPAFAPARAAYIAERALPEIGGEIGAAAGRAAAGPDAAPYFTVPESVPFYGGQDVGAEQVGRFVGGGLTDPLTYVGAAGAAAAGAPARRVAAELARGLPLVGEGELAVRGAVGAVRGLGSRAGEALGLAGNAERVAAADARMAAEGSTQAPGTLGAVPDAAPHVYSPEPPPATQRRYHGTSGAFDAADPARFDENGLYGPGYYTTSDPRVAGSYAESGATRGVQNTKGYGSVEDVEAAIQKHVDMRGRWAPDSREGRGLETFIAELEDERRRMLTGAPAGPNIRAIDIPSDVNLLDADAPLTQDVLDRVSGVIDRLATRRPDVAAEFRGELRGLTDLMAQRARSSDPVSTPSDFLLQRLFGAADRVSVTIKDGSYGAKGLATEILERAGFDGIAHQGGRRVPLLDESGRPIEHDVSVIFPGSINKVRNAFSGTYGGAGAGILPDIGGRSTDRLGAVNRVLGQGIASSVSGGVGAQVNQELNPDDPYAGIKGLAVGALVPPLAARGGMALARRAGAGAAREGGALGTLGAVPPARRTAATRNVVGPLEDRFSASGAQDVVNTYEGLTPARIAEAERRMLPVAVRQIAGFGADVATRERVGALLRATLDAGERQLDGSKVVATGLDGRALDAFIAGEGFTNKFTGTTSIEDAVDATWERVGRNRITRDQARSFVENERGADRMLMGAENLNDRMYAHVTAGPPLISEAKPSMHFIWEDDTPRVTSGHHHYALNSPLAHIHKDARQGIKDTVMAEGAVAGATREMTPEGPRNVGWERAAIPVEGRPDLRIADTPYAVGPSGESRMRMLTQLVSTPASGADSLGQMIRRGEITDPEQLASVFLRESAAQQQPATSAAKSLLGIPGGEAGGELGAQVGEQFKLGSAVNPTRNEAMILDPHPRNVKAIYLVGDGDAYLGEVLPKSGGVVKGTMTRLEAARAAQARISEQTGKRVPIIFKDTSVALDDAGRPVMASGGKTINDAVEIMPNGERLPITEAQRLAPGRGAIQRGYQGAGFSDIGVAAGTLPPGAATDRLGAVNRVLGQGIASSVSGGVGAQVNQELNPDDPYAGIKGFAAGALVPPLAARGGMALARRAGAVGERAGGRAFSALGALPDPDEIADLARRAAETPIARPRAEGEQVTRNVARSVARQAERGVPPDVPTAAMPPPDAPPGWFDKYNAYRYSIGMFSNISTGLVQLLGGAVDASLGIPTEAIRTGIIKGRPELLPAMARESIAAVPEMVRAAGRTARGDIPEQVLKGSEYRPPLSKQYEQRGEATKAAVAHAVEAPGRVMTQSPDAFWNEGFYKAGLAQAAADEAAREVGRTDPLGAIRRQNELIESPTPEVEARARQLAEDATYKGDLGLLASLLELPFKYPESLPGGKSGAAGFARGVGSHLLPVYRTIARIHERALEVTPGVGMLPLDRMGLAAPERARPFDQKLAQQAVGLGVATAVWSYAANGGIRGPGPTNPNQRQAMMDQGYVPNTFNVGGYWVPISWLGMYGPLVQGIASVNDAVLYDEGGKQFDALSAEGKVDRIVNGIGRGFRDYPFADASKTIMQLGQDPSASFAGLLGETAAQLTPAPLRTYLGSQDTWARRPDRGDDVAFGQKALDTFKQRSGLGRQSLPIAQDILGRAVPNPRQGWAAVVPRVGADRADPVIQAYLDNDVNIGDPPKKLSLEGMKDPENAPALSSAEQRRWNEIRGELVVGSVQGMLDDGSLAGAAPEARARKLEQIRDHAAAAAHRRLRVEMGAEVQRRLDENRARKAQRAS